jgi:hypothetical protein
MRRESIFNFSHLSTLSAGVLPLVLGEYCIGDVSSSLLRSTVIVLTLAP